MGGVCCRRVHFCLSYCHTTIVDVLLCFLRSRRVFVGLKIYGDAQESPQTESYWGNVNCHGECRSYLFLVTRGKPDLCRIVLISVCTLRVGPDFVSCFDRVVLSLESLVC